MTLYVLSQQRDYAEISRKAQAEYRDYALLPLSCLFDKLLFYLTRMHATEILDSYYRTVSD